MTDLINQVAGWLRSAINAHGPITEQNIGSAAKRIAGEVAHLESRNRELTDENAQLREELRAKEREVAKLTEALNLLAGIE